MNNRWEVLDIFRGSIIFLMIVYHFCFDLNYYHLTHFSFHEDLFWLCFRIFILSSFVLIAGISMSLSTGGQPSGLNWSRHLKRSFWLLLCATLVSLSSYFLFPASWIFFGVLHFMLTASFLGLLFYRAYWINLFLGLSIIAVGLLIQSKVFDQSILQWVGLMTYKPMTEDYVPMLPWFGVFLMGLFIGRLFTKNKEKMIFNEFKNPSFPLKTFSRMGKNSLLIYMVHQPLLMLAILLFMKA